LVILILVFAGCKDNAYAPAPPLTATSYFPETFGSIWKYRDSVYGEKTDTLHIFGVMIDTLTYTITGGTTDFNSEVCYNASKISVQYGPGDAYYYAKNHLCAFRESNLPLGLTNLQILIDTAAAGYSWVSNPSNNTLFNGHQVQTLNTIVEKNITRVVSGTTYTNVIHTSVDFQVSVIKHLFQTITHMDFYFAKGIGIIEKDTYAYGQMNRTETIIEYTIK
jgi:hypothetical protein